MNDRVDPLAENTPLLAVRNLSVSFRADEGRIQAVRDVSFDLHPGESLGIVGESGSGKSVTNLALLGLVPKPPGVIENGSALFDKLDLLKVSERKLQHIRGRRIAMIFQDPMTALNPLLSIGMQIAEVSQHHLGHNRRQAWNWAEELLERVGISSPGRRLRQYPHEFSGGMRQRVMIAIAIACNPEIIIADEPTTALDVTIQAQILDLLKDLQHEHQTAIIFITHDLGVVAEFCDRVAVMYGGRIVEQAAVEELFGSPAHPYTRGLLASVPRWDRSSSEMLQAIPGQPPNMASPPAGCAFHPRCPFARQRCRVEDPPLDRFAPDRNRACWADVDEVRHGDFIT